MPEPERSIFTDIVAELVAELQTMREGAREPAIPLGQEKVRRQTALNRLQRMKPEERRELIKQQGLEPIKKLLRGQDGR